jgi:hypothetical protein
MGGIIIVLLGPKKSSCSFCFIQINSHHNIINFKGIGNVIKQYSLHKIKEVKQSIPCKRPWRPRAL